MSAARSCCSLNVLLTVACGPCVAGVERGLERGRAGTGMEGGKGMGIATQAILTVVIG